MKRLFLLGLCLAVVVGLTVVDGASPEFAGTYLVEGQNPNGSAYRAHLTVELLPDSVLYLVTWRHPDSEQQGVAFIDGDSVTMMCIDSPCFGQYNWSDGKWAGKWVLPGAKDLFPETWTPTELTPDAWKAIHATPGRAL